jgi:hypothetical protein
MIETLLIGGAALFMAVGVGVLLSPFADAFAPDLRCGQWPYMTA